MKLLDLKALMAATEKVVALPEGEVRIRRLAQWEYFGMLPDFPPGVDLARTGKETPEELQTLLETNRQRRLDWFAALDPAAKVARRAEHHEATFAAVARALLEPVMTVDQVRRLGDGASTIFNEIEAFWQVDQKTDGNGAPAVEQAVAS
jgi:hypothetical protein